MSRTLTPDLSDREAAEALRVHVRTVQRWCAKGALPGAYKAGRRWRIPRASLDRLHSGAARRSAQGPLGELRDELRAVTRLLTRVSDHIDGADARTLEDLLSAITPLRDEATRAGKRATDRRRDLDHQLGGPRRAAISAAADTRA